MSSMNVVAGELIRRVGLEHEDLGLHRGERRVEPSGDRAAADAAYARWGDAVERSKGWAD